MKKLLNKIIAAALSLTVVTVSPHSYSVQAEEDSTKIFVSDYAETEEMEIEYLADYLRDEMLKGNSSIRLIRFYPDGLADSSSQIIKAVESHTGFPDEGDYLDRSSYYTYTSSSFSAFADTLFKFSYKSGRARENEVDSAVNSLIDRLGIRYKNDYQKIKAVYEWISANVKYGGENDLSHTAYAALINKQAVCEGYALLFYRLMLELGIDCRIITGTSLNEGHGWNIVKLGSVYYNIDCTFAATSKNNAKYFLKGSENFPDHTRYDTYAAEDFVSNYPMSSSDYSVTDYDKSQADVIHTILEERRVSVWRNTTTVLHASVYPSNGSQNIIWSSSDPSIASVDQNGIVSANKVGIAYISAGSSEGGKAVRCRIRVCGQFEHSGQAYAIYVKHKDSDSIENGLGELILFRSNEYYDKNGWTEDIGTVTDIYGNQYSGYLFGENTYYTPYEYLQSGYNPPWNDFKESIESVSVADRQLIRPYSTAYWFSSCPNLKYFENTGLDTSNVQLMDNMFYNCESLESIKFSQYNTSSCQSFLNVFANCPHLKTVDISAMTNPANEFYESPFFCDFDIQSFTFGNHPDQLIPDCSGTWHHGSYTKTMEELYREYPDHYEEYAGEWTRPHEHYYDSPTYTWKSDFSTVTAKTVCVYDNSHIVQETVNTTYEIIREASPWEEGLGRYTAKFTNYVFDTQTKDVSIPVTEPYEESNEPENETTGRYDFSPWNDPDPWSKNTYDPDLDPGDYGSIANIPETPFVPDNDVPGYVRMFRLYNPNSGEHFYTAKAKERDTLIRIGWKFEGIGWISPEKSSTPVYRLYNKYGGEHHYTMSAKEKDALIKLGWTYEGVGWYSDDSNTIPLYREYNPNMKACNHNYTTNNKEHDALVNKYGWNDEGIGWYGIEAPEGSNGIVRIDTGALHKELDSIMLTLALGGYEMSVSHINSYFSLVDECEFNLIDLLVHFDPLVDYSVYGLKGVTKHYPAKRSDPLKRFDYYGTISVSDVRWTAKNIFHLKDSKIDQLIKEGTQKNTYYINKNTFYFELPDYDESYEEKRYVQYTAVKSDGNKYYIEYYAHVNEILNYGSGYAILANEYIDGKYYWTVYEHQLWY